MPRNLLSLVMPPNSRSPWPTAAHTSNGIVFTEMREVSPENGMDFRPPNKILTLGSPEEVVVAGPTNKNCYEIIHSVYIVHWVLRGRSKKLKALKPQDLRCQTIGSVLKGESSMFTATIGFKRLSKDFKNFQKLSSKPHISPCLKSCKFKIGFTCRKNPSSTVSISQPCHDGWGHR